MNFCFNSNYSSLNNNYGINYGTTPASTPSLYEAYRAASRHASVDRTLTEPTSYNNNNNNNNTNNNSGSSSYSNPSTVRSSRQSSPVRTFEASERSFSSTLPPRPAYDYARAREKSSVPLSSGGGSVALRSRRESSQERGLMRPPTVTSLVKLRRSSFVDSANSSLSKYY